MAAWEIIERPAEHRRDELGEGAVWDAAAQALLWVDIVANTVFRLDPSSGRIESWRTPSMVSLAAPTGKGDLLVALQDGAYRFDTATQAATPIARPDPDPANRSNDAKVDPAGSLVLGTMFNGDALGDAAPKSPPASGGVFRVRADGSSERLLSGIGITNATAFSPDGRRMTFADTHQDTIWSFAYDPDGPLADQQVLLHGGPGHPDGAAMDADGCLWSARWGGNCVVRITPDGRIDRTIDLPARQPSCPAFGGPDLKTLYVTSARQSLKPPGEADGALFAIPMDVAGVPVRAFAG